MLKRNNEIVLRKVGEFNFLIDPRKSYNSDEEDVFQTNEIGAAIWELISEESDIDAIHRSLIALLKDEVDEELGKQIKEDILFFIDQLKCNGFVVEV